MLKQVTFPADQLRAMRDLEYRLWLPPGSPSPYWAQDARGDRDALIAEVDDFRTEEGVALHDGIPDEEFLHAEVRRR